MAWGEGGGGICGAVRCEEVLGLGQLFWVDKQLVCFFYGMSCEVQQILLPVRLYINLSISTIHRACHARSELGDVLIFVVL